MWYKIATGTRNLKKYIGHLFNARRTTNASIEHSINKINKSFYGFISKFEICHTTIKSKFFYQYCSSTYDSQLWNLTNQDVNDTCTQSTILTKLN